MLPPSAEGKVLACKGEWWRPEGGCAPTSHNSMACYSIVSVWYGTVVYGGSLLGTNNPYNRSSGPPCRLLYFCTTHSIICHSESYWGLIEGNPLYNQTSRLLIDRLFLVHSSSGSESSRIVLEPKKSFCAAIFPAARFMSHLWLGWPLVIRSALETTISRWPPPSAINNCDWSPLQLTMIRALTVTHTLVQDEPRQTSHETDIILSGYHISLIENIWGRQHKYCANSCKMKAFCHDEDRKP